MPPRFKCPQEHEWAAALDGVGKDGRLAVCPICGTPGVLLESLAFPTRNSQPPTLSTTQAPPFRELTPPPSWSLPGVAGYDIFEELGRGGMGIVYRAFDRRRGQPVALKTLQGLNPPALYRFKQEFRSLAELSHPNLITLHELISDGKDWVFTMELLDGRDFVAHIRGTAASFHAHRSESALSFPDPRGTINPDGQSAPLRPEQIERLRHVLGQLAQGVAALHAAGKLHRDIKPSNVLVTRQGRTVLLDFGLVAEMDASGIYASTEQHLAGTVAYMSPEQACCQPLTPASDWYSVGVMLHEVLTGRLPFHGSTYEILKAKQETDPPSCLGSDAPDDLARLCLQLLQRSPQARPGEQQIVQTLLNGLHGAAPSAPHQPAVSTSSPFIGRREALARLQEAYTETRRGQTATVLIHGASGMGKSALVRHFLNELVQQHAVVLLTGRCYEQESVPYKALDSLIDSVSRYLRRLPETQVQALLPRDVALLGRVFPVLGCVSAVASAPPRNLANASSQEIRRRAFLALRELLSRLGDRQPLVLFIDDLQWGDTDSGLLLAELIRPPDPPVLLLLASYRSQDRSSPCVQALREMQEQHGTSLHRQEIAVDALSPTETRDLVHELLGGAVPEELAASIVRESQGSPLFVQELVQHVQAEGSTAVAPEARKLSLDHVLWERIEKLPAPERRLLELVAVAGRPVSPQVACQAAELGPGERSLLARLRSGRLLRHMSVTDLEEIETYHDRVREVVACRLPPDLRAAHHRRLAETLERSAQADAEQRAVHWHGAGERERAGACYAQAAGQAAEALAFDRAARLYRSSLELLAPTSDEERHLRVQLAEALSNAGRGAEAAGQYLLAAEGADPAEALDFRRRAALRLLTCGHFAEGLETLPPLLHAAGLSLPGGCGRALATLLILRAWLAVRGLGFRLRPVAAISHHDLQYLDLCWSVGVGLFPLDLVAAQIFLTRGLLRALHVGEPMRLARSLALEACFLASHGGRRRMRGAVRAMDAAERVAVQAEGPSAQGLVLLSRGMMAYSEGHWKEACAFYDQAGAIYREQGVGVAFEMNLAHFYSLVALYYRGEIREVTRRSAALYQEARERDDFLATMLVGLIKLYSPLLADDLEGVRRDLEELLQSCPRSGFELLQHNVWMWQMNLALYKGDALGAATLAGQTRSPLERSLLQRSRHLRIPYLYKIACCNLAAAVEQGAQNGNRKAALRSAHRSAQQLRRESLAWARGLAGLIEAGIATVQKDRSRASRLLEDSRAIFEQGSMLLYAATTQRRLGELAASGQGADRIEDADRWMKEQGIQNPARLAALYVPGHFCW